MDVIARIPEGAAKQSRERKCNLNGLLRRIKLPSVV